MKVDCFTCAYANRDKHNRFISMCDGFGNCAYEPFDGEVKPTTDEFVDELLEKWNEKQFRDEHSCGIRYALEQVKEFLKDE